MSTNPKKYTSEEKAKIALAASSANEEELREIAEKNEVSVDELKRWVHETGVSDVTSPDADEEDKISLIASNEFANDFDYGATFDNLDYKTLFFWSAFGTTIIGLFVVAIFFIFVYTFQGIEQQSAERSLYYDIHQQHEQDQLQLNSFGVVDLEEGIYRIPIDSAISQLAEDSD
ncbi:hypothetical protein BH23BAC3_BH23BAC3_17690 [soil metagenome]